jgi:hypothetical protein
VDAQRERCIGNATESENGLHREQRMRHMVGGKRSDVGEREGMD